MPVERDIREAKNRIEGFLRTRGHVPKSRIHDDTAERALNRQRALNHPACRDCTHLVIEHRLSGRFKNSHVGCAIAENDPAVLYDKTPLGQDADCPDFEERDQSSAETPHIVYEAGAVSGKG